LFSQNPEISQNIGANLIYGLMINGVIYLPCYYANEIQFNSNAFVQDAMESEWLKYDEKHWKSMIILMQNLSKPCILKVLKVFKINLETFLWVS